MKNDDFWLNFFTRVMESDQYVGINGEGVLSIDGKINIQKLETELARLGIHIPGLEGIGTRRLLIAAKTEIEWWAHEHGCCDGHQDDVIRDLDEVLANDPAGGE